MVADDFQDRNRDTAIVQLDDNSYDATSCVWPTTNPARAEKRSASREQLYAAKYESRQAAVAWAS